MIGEIPASVHGTRRDPDKSRLKTDTSNTAFWEGKEYYFDREILDLSGTLVFKFELTKDAIIQAESLTCDNGGLRMRVYREGQGVEGGTFDTTEVIEKNAVGGDFPVVDTTSTMLSGGTFTPSAEPLGKSKVTLRVSSGSSGGSGKGTAVEATVGSERGVPLGIGYIVVDSIAQSGSSSGVLYIKFEERD